MSGSPYLSLSAVWYGYRVTQAPTHPQCRKEERSERDRNARDRNANKRPRRTRINDKLRPEKAGRPLLIQAEELLRKDHRTKPSPLPQISSIPSSLLHYATEVYSEICSSQHVSPPRRTCNGRIQGVLTLNIDIDRAEIAEDRFPRYLARISPLFIKPYDAYSQRFQEPTPRHWVDVQQLHMVFRTRRRPTQSTRKKTRTTTARATSKGASSRKENPPTNPRRIMKTKPTKTAKRKQKKKPAMTPSALLAQAEDLLHTGRPDEALPLATKALSILQPSLETLTPSTLPAHTLLAEINLELGSPSTARSHFLAAVALDLDGSIPESEGGGAEKFFWLAQLSEEGGRDSVDWFEKGAEALRREIMGMVEGDGEGEAGDAVEGMMRRLASALCGIVEIYMTDLSKYGWEPDAEAHCEKLITEALLAAPTSPEPLQTLASIRISQTRLSEAKKALSDSMALWKDLPPEDPSIPDFPTRISLARLLMEVEMEEDALMIVERLVSEDDQSVEAWYLGGWCLYLLGQKRRKERDSMADDDDDANDANEREELYTASLVSSREWLRQSLELYELSEYEDDRLRDHALELVEGLDKELEGRDIDGAEEGSVVEGDWESEGDEEEGEDEEMDGT